jgi:molybdenum cofactor cytidylyltransferase
VVPLYNGTRGNPVIFVSTLREKLLCLHGDSGGRVLLEGLDVSIITVDFADEKLGLDIDTREEYEAILKLEGENG